MVFKPYSPCSENVIKFVDVIFLGVQDFFFLLLKGTKYGWLVFECDIKSLFFGSPVVDRLFILVE